MKGDDRRLLVSIQDGIPLTETPFRDIGASLGLGEADVKARLLALIDNGTIRRFGARIDHRKLGIVANAMVCWNIPDGDVERAGRIISGYPGVTHCYERAVIPGVWEYNLFCVIHGRSVAEVEQGVRDIEEQAGINGHVILFSKKKFKHTPAAIITENDP
jgi:DNA-binding Lrp family transcriptional regulator